MKQHYSYYQMDTRVFDQGLKPIPFAVYSYLVSCAGSRGSCFPSVRTIAQKCCCSDSSVRDALRTLEDRGLIRKDYGYRENRYGLRQQTSNTYHVLRLPDYYENGEPRYAERLELPL